MVMTEYHIELSPEMQVISVCLNSETCCSPPATSSWFSALRMKEASCRLLTESCKHNNIHAIIYNICKM